MDGTAWSPGDTSPDSLIEGAGELGSLIAQKTLLGAQWSILYDKGMVLAFEDNQEKGGRTVPESVLKAFARQYCREQNPELVAELQGLDSHIDGLILTAKVVEAATTTSFHRSEASVNRVMSGSERA